MTSTVTLKILVDNQAQDGLSLEHGLAIWISIDDMTLLFDTGAGCALLHNAAKLGVDLAKVESLVLSHGHADHTGGVAQFLELNSRADVYVGQGIAIPRYTCHSGEQPRQIGMKLPDYQSLLTLNAGKVKELHAPQYLMPGVGLTGPIPHKHTIEDTGGPFYTDPDCAHPDPISDDLAIWFETTNGLVIVTGCCHAGVLNTVQYIQQISGKQQVSGIVGGLHLLNASAKRLEETIAGLSELRLQFLAPAHCTGARQIAALQKAIGNDVVIPCFAGMTMTLGTLQ